LFLQKIFSDFFISRFFKNFLLDKTVLNYFLFQKISNYNISSNTFVLSDLKNHLFYNIIFLVFLNYIDKFFFKHFIPFEASNTANAFVIHKHLVFYSFFKFFDISVDYYDSSAFFHGKLALDLLL